ncbi:MAG TPA: Na+/H+ antiporter [Myxococcota bacterium]|nr:Na+/H+ antiporter [Myxococcota bacterium]
MNGLELVLILLVVAAGLAVVATRLGVPYPILLVAGGLALALVPGLPRVAIDPQLVLVIFLPPLLFSAAWFTSWRDFAANRRSIGLLAVGLVIVTTTAVAAAAHACVPEMGWPSALVLGAIVSPPDAVAATAVLQRLKVPRRVVTIVEGESLVNDATGLVAYKLALMAVATGGVSATWAAGEFALVAAGGVAFGLAAGWAVAQIHRRLDDFQIEIAITLLTPYATYIPAEHLGLSGVLATVAAGGYLGWHNPELLSALTRFRGRGTWSVLLLLANGLVFILIGLQLATIRDIAVGPALIGQAALVSAAAIAARLVYVPIASYLPRFLSPRLRARDPYPPWQAVALVGWTGMRGIVSLALALSVPLVLADGSPFPQRDAVIVLSFAVIFATLVVQGLSLPHLIRWLGLEPDDTDLREEREALIEASRAALARLEEIDNTVIVHPLLIERLRAPYEERLERLTTEARDDPECRLTEGESAAYRRLRGEALAAERRAAVALRNDGRVSEEVLHRVQESLDLEALQPDR